MTAPPTVGDVVGVPRLPKGSCDSHVHVFGPLRLLPPVGDPSLDAPAASLSRMLAMHTALGFDRGVLVQPSVYGEDHRALCHALTVAGPNYRGCAAAAALLRASDGELAALHAAGVRGARFARPGLPSTLGSADTNRVLARLGELGWYAKIQPAAEGLAATLPLFSRSSAPLVIDHMGRPDISRGLDDPSLCALLDLLGRGDVWVLLSFAERLSVAGPPWDDVVPFARKLVEAAPHRCVFGSDWPHVGSSVAPVEDGALLALIWRYAPEGELRQRILVDNPAHLFGLSS